MASAAAARTAGTATTAAAAAGGRRGGLPGDTGGKGGELLGQFFGTAFGAGGAFPTSRADQHFAVRAALLTMELVNRHGGSIGRRRAFGNDAVSYGWTK